MSPTTVCQTPLAVRSGPYLESHHELPTGAERMTTEVLVCVLCRPADLSRDMPRPGRALFEAIEDMALRDELPLRIRPVDCMSGCKRHCTVALQAAGKTSYFFGDLLADDVSAEQVLACAALYQASPDGFLSRDARPERLRAGILARLPAPFVALS
jgi:predicted metal-binding protein